MKALLLKKKIIIAILIIIFALPFAFYLKWFFAANKFKSVILHKIESYARFAYKDCDISGFWSQDFNLKFTDPILYFGSDEQSIILRSDYINLIGGKNNTEVKISVANSLNAKLAKQSFICQNVENISLNFDNQNKKYFDLFSKQRNLNCASNEEGGFNASLDIGIKSDLLPDLFQFVEIIFNSSNSNKTKSEYNLKIIWDTKDPTTLYNVEIKNAAFTKSNLYKITLSGNPALSFTYQFNFYGDLNIEIDGHESFLQNIIAQVWSEEANQKTLKIVDFFKSNSEIKDQKLHAHFTGNGDEVFLGGKDVLNTMKELFPAA